MSDCLPIGRQIGLKIGRSVGLSGNWLCIARRYWIFSYLELLMVSYQREEKVS